MIGWDVFKAIVNNFRSIHLWPHYISITAPLRLCVEIPISIIAPMKLFQNVRFHCEFCHNGKAKLAATGFNSLWPLPDKRKTFTAFACIHLFKIFYVNTPIGQCGYMLLLIHNIWNFHSISDIPRMHLSAQACNAPLMVNHKYSVSLKKLHF